MTAPRAAVDGQAEVRRIIDLKDRGSGPFSTMVQARQWSIR